MSIFSKNRRFIKLNNGINLPIVGLGGWKQDAETVSAAIEKGYRLIDTAAQYGNEKDIGQAIIRSKVNREELFITSKLWTEDIRKNNVKSSFMETLENLKTDYLDLYLIHWPAEGYQNAWIEMEKLYREGKIRAIGVSNFEEHHIEEIVKIGSVIPSLNQIESHPYFANERIISFCKSKNITVQAWCPLGGPVGAELRDETIQHIASIHKKDPAQVILRWHIQRNVAVIPKSSHVERMLSNISVFDFSLSGKEMKNISALNKNQRLGANPNSFTF